MLLRISILSLAALVLVTVALLGFRGDTSTRPPIRLFPDMVDQPKYKPQEASLYFGDGRAQRLPVAGTVAWGRDAMIPDPTFAVSDQARFAMTANPLDLDRELLTEGQRLYGVYCAVCHGGAGEGNGITTAYGMTNPPSYHGDRLRQVPDGEIYKVITQGKGQMGPYAGKLEPDRRWAVVAYLRALQRAFTGTLADVPPEHRKELER
jgi:mono/diheme cytochrome c family protein